MGQRADADGQLLPLLLVGAWGWRFHLQPRGDGKHWDNSGRSVQGPSSPVTAVCRYGNKSPVVECQQYLWEHSVRIGCRFEQREIIQFQPFHVRVNASQDGRTLEIPSNCMELQNLGTWWRGDTHGPQDSGATKP